MAEGAATESDATVVTGPLLVIEFLFQDRHLAFCERMSFKLVMP